MATSNQPPKTEETNDPIPQGKQPLAKKSLELPFKITPLFKILVIFLAILLILIILLSLLKPNRKSQLTILLPPTPSPVSSQVVERKISQFAQSEEFKRYEEKLNNIRVENDRLDLNESKLVFPLLDMDINFEK